MVSCELTHAMNCRYRTLADAVGLLSHVESSVDGVSLMPVVMDPSTAHLHEYPPDQFPRCSSLSPGTGRREYFIRIAEKLPELTAPTVGTLNEINLTLWVLLRTPEYRITRMADVGWYEVEGRWDLPPNATELYDHGTSAT